MTKLLGVDFAPLNVPLQRRVQTLFVILHVLMMLAPIFGMTLLLLLFVSRLWWLAAFYVAYLVYDRRTPKSGGRNVDFLRDVWLWDYFRRYFPMTLEKTADLDPSRNYILGYHPHGIAAFGVFGNILFGGEYFHRKFPGIKTRACTLGVNFWMPFSRDLIMAWGLIDVGKESIRNMLTQHDRGNAVVIVVGGAQEAFNAKPGNAMLKLKNRRGFVKMAITTGSDLVPMYSFGENDLFSLIDTEENSWVRRIQEYIKRLTLISPLLFHGRGVFNYTFGLIPYRRRIHTVVGSPISVEKNETPTDEEVVAMHQKYVNALTELFEKHKTKYGYSEETKLTMY